MDGSTRLLLRVAPGATRAGVVGRHGEAWKIRVAAPPEDGRANDEVVGLLSSTLGIARRDVAIASGHGARDKVVSVIGVAPAELERLLTDAADRRQKVRA